MGIGRVVFKFTRLSAQQRLPTNARMNHLRNRNGKDVSKRRDIAATSLTGVECGKPIPSIAGVNVA
ncbi:hypothetical protein C0J52_03718 [Blattella germanica]|nr:hypothetical protein C0J52_03718 [Blattella germanica]